MCPISRGREFQTEGAARPVLAMCLLKPKILYICLWHFTGSPVISIFLLLLKYLLPKPRGTVHKNAWNRRAKHEDELR